MADVPLTPDAPLSPDDSVTAAELALGLLDGAERADALRRSLAEPAFAREVERWRDHFATLFASGGDVAPATDLEARVMRRIEDRAHRHRGWRAAAIALGGIAAALALVVLYDGTLPTPAPVAPPSVRVAPVPAPAHLLAAMTATDKAPGDPAFGILYDPARNQARIAGAVSVPAGRAAELWSIGADGVPRSLGVLPAGRVVAIRPADRARLHPGITLAVSIEPGGGSPTGLPTGPVVATGTLAAT